MVNVLLSFQREKVISVAQSARRMGLVVLTFGNFSLRDEETGYICITPSGMDYDELKPEDIVVVNRDGAVIEGRRTPSVETPLHCAVYRHRNDVFGVCHTHSVFATAWACCNVPFPVIVAELAVLVGGRLDTAPYRPLGTPELAEAVVKTLGGVKHAVLMANHGVLTVGADLDAALRNALTVEKGAKTAYLARGIGQVNVIEENECEKLQAWAKARYGQKP